MTSVQRTDFAHFVPVNTRWGDMDTLGHVNNTVFYQYSEEGRINYFTDILGIGASGDTSGSSTSTSSRQPCTMAFTQ